MSDEELDSALEGISETLRGFFLRELSDSELEEILKRDTVLVHPLNVTTAIIVDSVEDIPSNPEEPDVKTYDKAYKYYLDLSEGLEISAGYVSKTGMFYVAFDNAKKKDGTAYDDFNRTVTVSISNASQPANTNTFESSVTVSADTGSSSLSFSVGTPVLVRQNYGTNNAQSWSGVYLKDMSFYKPQYHSITGYENNVITGTVGQGRLDLFTYNEDGSVADTSSLSSPEKALDSTGKKTQIKVDLECNSYNCGLENPGTGLTNRTLTIHFNRPSYKVTYNGNGATKGSASEQLKMYGANITVKDNYFKREGHKFVKWNTSKKGTGTSYKEGATYSKNEKATLYAQWEEKTYTVEYDLNGGTGTFNDQTKYYTKDLTLHSSTPEKDGYEFVEWKAKDGTKYSAGDTYTKNANTTMTAVWKAKSYKVTIKYLRKPSSTSTSDKLEEVGSATFKVAYTTSFTPDNKIKTGTTTYKDYGYSIVNQNKDNGINYYTYYQTAIDDGHADDEDIITGKTITMPSHDIVIQMKYYGIAVTPTPSPTPVPAYNLTVDPNGGTIITPDGDSTTDKWTKTYKYGENQFWFCTGYEYWAEAGWEACSLPTREGCTFAGWSKSPSNAEIDQCKFSPWWDFHTNLKTAVTVTAQWNANLTYEYYKYDAANDTWVQMDEPEETYTQSVGTETFLTSVVSRASAKTPEGYEIDKYTVDSVDGAELSTVCDKGVFKIQKNTTICICYMPKELNLTIDVKNGTYYTAAGLEDEDFGTTFTYGVEREFSSKDINNYVTGGMSLPTKVGYHLCDPNNSADVTYAQKNSLSTEPWVISSGTGDVLDEDVYSFDGLSAVDVTIEANWIPDSYTLTVDPNGGSFYTPDSKALRVKTAWSKEFIYETSTCYAHDYEGACDTNLNAVSQPIRTGYTFAGWKQTVGGGSTSKTSIYNYFNGDYTGDVTFTAQWTPNVYKISLDYQDGKLNGSGINGPGGPSPLTIIEKYNTSWGMAWNGYTEDNYYYWSSSPYYPATGIKATREGYTFNGFYTSINGQGTKIIDETGKILVYPTQFTSDETIYAYWTPNTYILTVDPNGGSMYNGDNLVSSSFTTNAVYGRKTCLGNLTSNDTYYANYNLGYPKKTGHTFTHWTFDHGTGGTNTDGSKVYFSDTVRYTTAKEYAYNGDYAGNVTATAQWQVNQYDVVCEDRVGSTTGTLLGSSTWKADYGTTVSGASKGTDTTAGAYYTGYKYKSYTTANVTTSGAKVYRIFEPVTSTLIVNPNGGTWNGSTDTKSFTKSYKETLAIPDPTKPNYTATFNANGGTCNTGSLTTNMTFTGWSKSSPFTAGELNTSTKVFTFGSTDNGKGTLTAQWTGNYNIVLPTPNEWKGHDFIGWYTAATGGSKVGDAGATVTLSKNVTYYAQWKAHPTKITLSNTVDKSKVAFVKGNPVAVFKVTGTDVMGAKHTFIKTLKWDTTSNNYQSLSFTILSGTYTVTLLSQNEYTVGTPSGSSNVTASGTTASVNMSDGSEGTVNYSSNETDYSKYTGNSLVVTSLK